MDASDAAAIGIACAGFLVSVFTWWETQRQGRNAIRPLLVLIEKKTDNTDPDSKLSLFLVNMGEAAAINVDLPTPKLAALRQGAETTHTPLQTEIAAHRKALLLGGYAKPLLTDLRLRVEYGDMNGRRYVTVFDSGEPPKRRHTFRPAESG